MSEWNIKIHSYFFYAIRFLRKNFEKCYKLILRYHCFKKLLSNVEGVKSPTLFFINNVPFDVTFQVTSHFLCRGDSYDVTLSHSLEFAKGWMET